MKKYLIPLLLLICGVAHAGNAIPVSRVTPRWFTAVTEPATPPTDLGVLYGCDVSDITEACWKDENGDVTQLTSGGTLLSYWTDDLTNLIPYTPARGIQTGNATNDTGSWTMIKGAQTSDPQVALALSADANGDFSVTADTGDITLSAADDIYLTPTGDAIIVDDGSYLQMGTTAPASDGQIRLRNSQSIKARNKDDDGDIILVVAQIADGTTNEVQVGQSGLSAIRLNSNSVYVPGGDISPGVSTTDLNLWSSNDTDDINLKLNYGLGIDIGWGSAQTSGVPYLLKLTPSAHTGSTATTAIPQVHFDFDAANRTWATGAITTQNEFQIDAPTYAFAGASTITTANTVYIANAPQAGANATLTNAYALNVAAGTSRFAGGLTDGTFSASSGAFTGVASITDGTASWSSNDLSGFGSIASTSSLSDGTATLSSGAWSAITTLGLTQGITQAPTVTGTLYDFELETEWTTGTLINADFGGSTTLSGDVSGMNLDFQSNVTATGYSVDGFMISLPNVVNTGAGTYSYDGFYIDGGSVEQNTGAGTNIWNGFSVDMPDITETTGSVTSVGLNLTGGTVTSGTQNLIFGSMTQTQFNTPSVMVETTLGADVALISGITSNITGYASGGTSSNIMFAYDASVTGDDNDNDFVYVAYNANTSTKSGGTSEIQAFGAGDGYDISLMAGSGIIAGNQGSDLASANDMAAPTSNYVDVTGTTQINTMATGYFTAGSFVVLQFDGSVTVKHATAGAGAQFFLQGAGDFSATANDTLMLVYDGTYFREVSRSVN